MITMIKYIYNQIYCSTKNWGFYLDGVWLWRISGGIHRRWRGWF